MAEFQLPEMLRTPLEELVLQIKILKLGKALPFLQKAIEPPKEEAVRNAIQCLRDLVSNMKYPKIYDFSVLYLGPRSEILYWNANSTLITSHAFQPL